MFEEEMLLKDQIETQRDKHNVKHLEALVLVKTNKDIAQEVER